MSIPRNMKKYILQRKTVVRTPSGAERIAWVNVGNIDVAVYKKNDFKTVASEKYLKATHTGLTRYRRIAADKYRLVGDGIIYVVTECNPEGRLTNLLLEVVMDGG